MEESWADMPFKMSISDLIRSRVGMSEDLSVKIVGERAQHHVIANVTSKNHPPNC